MSSVRETIKTSLFFLTIRITFWEKNDLFLYSVFDHSLCLYSDPAGWWEQRSWRKSRSLPRWPVGNCLWWSVGWRRCWSCLSAAWPWVCFSTYFLFQQQSRRVSQIHSLELSKDAPLKSHYYFEAATKFIYRRFRYSANTFKFLELWFIESSFQCHMIREILSVGQTKDLSQYKFWLSSENPLQFQWSFNQKPYMKKGKLLWLLKSLHPFY